jgi:DNA gyrase subunit A
VSLVTDDMYKEWEAILISKSGQTIRIPLKSIRSTSRVTQWVILTKIHGKDDVLVSATAMKVSVEDEEIPSTPEDDEE